MLDISRSSAQAFQHILPNILATLSNIVLVRRDAHLKHVHQDIDSFRKKNLLSASVVGLKMFDRSTLQEYEKHFIGLGSKPSQAAQQSGRYTPYHKKNRGPGRVTTNHRGHTIRRFRPPSPQYVVPQTQVFQPGPQYQRGSFRGGRSRGRRQGRSRPPAHSKQQ